MRQGFHAELKRLLTVLVLALFIGWVIDKPVACLMLAGAGYIGWLLRQMHLMQTWLTRHEENLHPPESSGLWGDIFDRIYHMQRHHQQEKQELQAVVTRIQETTRALRDGVILLDQRGHLDFWNPAAQRLLGFHARDQGLSVINFIRHPRFVSYFEGGEYDDPLELPSPRFNAKQLQFQITRFGKNERLIVVRDVTRIHNLEQMRQDFVANVSHELRTPLTVINGYLETLADHNDKPAWDRPLQQMQQQTRRMALLINDLLLLSQLETTDSRLNLKRVALGPMLAIIRSEAMALGSEKSQQIILECEPDLYLSGNEKELHSAFSNLVFNAVKYTPEQGRILMSLRQEKDRLVFSVTDNGPGIEQKHLPRLTERFYRVDASRNSGTGGTGLGLAIVKHVLLRHDAELKISSEPGKGSTFTCEFPLESQDAS